MAKAWRKREFREGEKAIKSNKRSRVESFLVKKFDNYRTVTELLKI